MIYLAVDGDDIGRLLTGFIYSDDPDTVAAFSSRVQNYYRGLADLVVSHGGTVIFCTGDSVLARIPEETLPAAQQYLEGSQFTSSAGVGDTLRRAHWALNIAKSLGKDRLVDFARIQEDLCP